MASVIRELELLRCDMKNTVAVAEVHSHFSVEFIDRVRSFESDVVRPIENAVEVTSSDLAQTIRNALVNRRCKQHYCTTLLSA
jgi:hypothetical protein